MSVDKNADVQILVVEDDELNREIMYDILVNENYQVDLAGDGIDAVQLYKSYRYSMVLMDIMMPKMGGIEAATEISRIASKYTKSTSIIAVTAMDIEAEKNKLLCLGFCDFIRKPFDNKELLLVIKKYSSPSQYHRTYSSS